MKLSAFRSEITPPLGHPLCAGWYPPAQGISHPLFANGVVLFPENQSPIVLCALDWAELSNGEHDLWRNQLAQAAGTTPDRVAIHCIHAHDTPWPDREAQTLLDETGNPPIIMQRAWCDEVLQAMGGVVRSAIHKAVVITEIRVGHAPVRTVASNRRILGPDGKIHGVRWTSCPDAALRAEPEGLIDPNLKTISFWGEGRKLAGLHYYAVHPTSYDGTGWVTPDFVGIARERLSEAEGVPHVYFTECAGNITCGKYNDGMADNREWFARQILDAMVLSEQNARAYPPSEVRWITDAVILPPREDLTREAMQKVMRDPEAAQGAKSRAALALAYRNRCEAGIPITISALRIGDGIAILHLPGEAFIEYQLFAQSLCPGVTLAVPAYGDCGPGYIPLTRSFEEGGYEPADAFCSPESQGILEESIRRILAAPASGRSLPIRNPGRIFPG